MSEPATIKMCQIERGCPEWLKAWEGLAWADGHLRNDQGKAERVSRCEDCGQTWQYMGTELIPVDGWTHIFRHRHHPVTKGQVHIRVPVTDKWTPPLAT